MCSDRAGEREGELDDLVYLGLGSNMGERREQIDDALGFLVKSGVRVVRRSPFYETEPVGYSDQPWYLNAVVAMRTDLSPTELLSLCKEAERRGNRVHSFRFGPRTIDVDILLYKGQIHRDNTLQIPHPRMHERRFVLVPLVEIAPGITVPGEQTQYADILAGLDEKKKVAKSKEHAF
ncbi:MAG TPA: 2-amino-4-hydroxy-6-hydroxymethyldihydropteridine diphosphokinase [Candidatus Acetothermia bacterium]|nr:2-amino-4-hydroxy-6-hydroxymethyldihydropteridine diphosphokinase [Candidatus Acetothermia bacterium]